MASATTEATPGVDDERWISWPGRLLGRTRWWLGEASTRAGRQRLMERSGFQGAVFHSWLFPITRHGKLLLCAFAFTALPAGISLDVPMYEVTVGVVCLLLVATGVGSWYRLVRTSISGGFPATVVSGEQLIGRVRVENRGWVALFDVGAGCFLPPRVFQPVPDETVWSQIRPGEAPELTIQFRVEGRGRYRLPPVRAFTLFPFGIGRTEFARLPSASVLVLPRIPRVALNETAAPPGQADDQSQLRRGRSDATEYMGGREYVPGDEPRLIDHRAWARTGRLVVREWGVPAHRGRIVVLDTRLPTTLPQPWPGLRQVRGKTPRPLASIWLWLRPAAERIRRWWLWTEARVEQLVPAVAAGRYARLASDAAASLVAGMLFQWTSRHEPCEFVCDATPVRRFDLDPGREPFEAAWEYLGEAVFRRNPEITALEQSLGEALEGGQRSIWIVTSRPDEALARWIERLRREGHDVRALALTAGEAGVPEGFTPVSITAVLKGDVHVD